MGGVCISKMKEVAGGIDKKAVEMGVKAKKIDIARKAQALAASYSSSIANGQTLTIPPSEILPVTDPQSLSPPLQMQLSDKSTELEILRTALYVSTNTIYRNTLKKTVYDETVVDMKAKKLPDAVITHSGVAINAVIDKALDMEIDKMSQNVIKGNKQLITREEEIEVEDYFRAKEAAKAAAAGGDKEHQPAPLETKQAGGADEKLKDSNAKAPVDHNQVKLDEPYNKAIEGQQSGAERDSNIRVTA